MNLPQINVRIATLTMNAKHLYQITRELLFQLKHTSTYLFLPRLSLVSGLLIF